MQKDLWVRRDQRLVSSFPMRSLTLSRLKPLVVAVHSRKRRRQVIVEQVRGTRYQVARSSEWELALGFTVNEEDLIFWKGLLERLSIPPPHSFQPQTFQ